MTYFNLMQQMVESLGGRLMSAEEVFEEDGIRLNLTPEMREALRTDMEDRIRRNNQARSSSWRAAAHDYIDYHDYTI